MALEMNGVFDGFDGFDKDMLPYAVPLRMKESDWITSCTGILCAEAPLLGDVRSERTRVPHSPPGDQRRHLSAGCVRNGRDHGNRQDTGVLLVSYIWEDDAASLEANANDAAPWTVFDGH